MLSALPAIALATAGSTFEVQSLKVRCSVVVLTAYRYVSLSSVIVSGKAVDAPEADITAEDLLLSRESPAKSPTTGNHPLQSSTNPLSEFY